MISKCAAVLKITILSADILAKILLATLLLVTTTHQTFGMAILIIMWLPAFLFILSYILRCGDENSRLSPSQMLFVLTLFPFLPIIMAIDSWRKLLFPSPIKKYLVELETFLCIVSCSRHMVLVLWSLLTAAIDIEGRYEGELYLNLCFC